MVKEKRDIAIDNSRDWHGYILRNKRLIAKILEGGSRRGRKNRPKKNKIKNRNYKTRMRT